jgi:hypothetical protein
LVYPWPLYPRVYGAEPGFGIAKLCTVCMYPCPNLLAVVCCDIPKIGTKPETSTVVRLRKWFTGWVEGVG